MTGTRSEQHLQARRIFQNFGFLTIGKILGDVFTFAFFVALSRTFGKEGIGLYSFAMALTGFFGVLADFGLYDLSIRDMSRRTGSPEEDYSRIFTLRVILSLLSFSVLLLLLPFLSFSREGKLIITFIGAYQIMYVLVWGFAAVFVAKEAMHIASLLELSLRSVTALVGIAIISAGGGLVITLTTLPAVTFAQLFVAYAMVANKYGRPRIVMSWSSVAPTLRQAVPYSVSAFLSQLSGRVEVVLLGFFLGAAAAGVYNVAYRVVFFLLFLPYFAGAALFPVASRLYTSSHEQLQGLYHKSLNLIILIGLPVSCGLWIGSTYLIDLVFGEAFAEAGAVLGFLAWLVFLTCLKTIFGTFLMSCDRQTDRTMSQCAAACVNVLASIALIPAFGVKGAALATVVSETLLVILLGARLGAVLGWKRLTSSSIISWVSAGLFCAKLW
jgi:O-antigen/teichoic acid export membrane protein